MYYFVFRLKISSEMVENKNVQAFLKMIRACEGTDSEKGYRTMYSYLTFDDFKEHPNKKIYFKNPKTGKQDYTTAAGAYQMVYPTWRRLQLRLNLPDFSPQSQDLAAIGLIKEFNALDDVIKGDIKTAIKKLKTQWASLPSSEDKQNPKSWAFALDKYKQNGGLIV